MALRPIVGLDIGTQQIKVVEVRPAKGVLTISALGIAPTPVGILQNNIITDPRLMGQTIKQLFRESGIKSKKVAGTVAGQSAVVVRIIEVPKMNDGELKETMKWEVERHVPFAPSETVIDYQRLEPVIPDDDNPNMEVLLAVAQQDIINNFVDTVWDAKLDPVSIDIEPLAIGRGCLDVVDGRPLKRQRQYSSVEAPFEGSGHETVAVVSIGASNTDISIFQDGQLAFPRSLPLAGDSFTRAIAEAMGYTLDQAERIKRDYAAVQIDRMAVYTGTAYGDDPTYESPQFRDDQDENAVPRDSARNSGRGSTRLSGRSGRISGRLGGDDAPLGNPFDLSGDTDAPEGQPDMLNLAKPGDLGEIERTQPMSRRMLNLARKPDGDGDASLGVDVEFNAGLAGSNINEAEIRDQVFEAIAPVLGELGTEIRRSLDYYRSRAQGRSVDRVLLAGGSANLINIAQFLQNELQVPVSLADPFAGLKVSTKHYDPDYLHSLSSSFAVAFGLAAQEAIFSANPPPKVRRVRPPKVAKEVTAVS